MGMAAKKTLLAPTALALGLSMLLAGCAKGRAVGSDQDRTGPEGSKHQAGAYTPKTRTVSMFAVPAWIGEMADIPQYKEFAPKDFKKGGLNDGNEVFSWQPQMMASCVGDTIALSIANPGPDDHSFTLPDFSVNSPIPAFKVTTVSIKTGKAGIYDYYCTVAEHTKYMHGTLLVFTDSDPMCAGS
jgi:plastocyanin